MKKIISICLIIASIWSMGYSQDYKTGIGLRGGLFNGITVKHFISSNTALEGLASTRWDGFEITGLYEIHRQAFDIERLNWYYGFGAHIGVWNGNKTDWGNRGTNYTVVGIDGILGMEYNFR